MYPHDVNPEYLNYNAQYFDKLLQGCDTLIAF